MNNLKVNLLGFAICMAACVQDRAPDASDAGRGDSSTQPKDGGLALDTESNVGEEAGSSDARDDNSCPCPRGWYCDRTSNTCTSVAGCYKGILQREDLGCLFLPGTVGRVTTAECETDLDCVDSEYGATCILRVCHDLRSCEDGEECPEGFECRNFAACMLPREPCESDEDCPPSTVCFVVDKLCG